MISHFKSFKSVFCFCSVNIRKAHIPIWTTYKSIKNLSYNHETTVEYIADLCNKHIINNMNLKKVRYRHIWIHYRKP